MDHSAGSSPVFSVSLFDPSREVVGRSSQPEGLA